MKDCISTYAYLNSLEILQTNKTNELIRFIKNCILSASTKLIYLNPSFIDDNNNIV